MPAASIAVRSECEMLSALSAQNVKASKDRNAAAADSSD